MAKMAEVEWLGEHGSATMTEASLNKVCLHTIVGNPPAHAAHFSVWGNGHIGQSRDTKFQSAANLHGNDDVIAIECDDTGPEFGDWDHNNSKEVPYFTAAQIESIAEILVWAYYVHGIPLVACPDSKDSSEGIAYHRQGIDGNFLAEGYAYPGRVPGGEVWTNFPGKACPGDRRISQIPAIIHRARVLAGLEPAPVPNPIDNEEEDGMKTYYVHGDDPGFMPAPHQTTTWGDAVFLVEATVDGLKRRHVSPDEWWAANAAGAKLSEHPQAWVDSLPWGAKEGLFWWENEEEGS